MEDNNEIKINVSQEPKKPKYDEWEIKDAVRTLIRAEEILYGSDRKEEANNEKTNS